MSTTTDSHAADAYLDNSSDGYGAYKTANDAALISDASMWLHTVDHTQTPQFSCPRDQTLWPLLNKSAGTSGCKNGCRSLTSYAPATLSCSGVSKARGDTLPIDFRAGGNSTGRPCRVRSHSPLDLPSMLVFPKMADYEWAGNGFINEGTCMKSYASTALDESPMPLDGNAVSTYVQGGGSATGHLHVKSDIDEARPASSRRKSSNNSRRVTQSAGRPSRMPHSQVERRYRNNIKFHLDALTSRLPAMWEVDPSAIDSENPDRVTKGLSKALVIASAVRHIETLESDKTKTKQFIKALQDQIEGLQSLVRASDCAIRRHMQADSVSQS